MESSQISITFQFVKLSREWSGQNNVQWPFIKIFHRQKWHHWTKLRFLGRNKITWHSDFSHSDFMREQWQIKKTEKTVAHWSVIRCNIIWDRGARASWLHIDCTEAVCFFCLCVPRHIWKPRELQKYTVEIVFWGGERVTKNIFPGNDAKDTQGIFILEVFGEIPSN